MDDPHALTAAANLSTPDDAVELRRALLEADARGELDHTDTLCTELLAIAVEPLDPTELLTELREHTRRHLERLAAR